MRVFGGPGRASYELRRYAALHGIIMLDSSLWPVPVLATDEFAWPVPLAGPPHTDRHLLAWGGRAWQTVMKPLRDGFFVEVAPAAARVDSFLRMHEYWSDELCKALSPRARPSAFAGSRSGAQEQIDGFSA